MFNFFFSIELVIIHLICISLRIINCRLNFNLKKSLWAAVLLLVMIAWIFGLFIDLTGDAGLYASISRQMADSGNWLDLKINGQPYDQKPHLLFWLAGLGIQLFGNTNMGFKLFPFLFGLTGLYFTYRLAKLLFSRTAGKLAALFAGTSQLFFLYFMDIHTDTVLQTAVILSLWQFAEYMKSKKTLHFILGFTGTGLAMLTKGPVGAVLPFFFVFFYLLLKNDYRQLFNPKWLVGITLVMLIISPSLYHLWEHFGTEGFWFYFIDNNIGRVSGKVAGSSTDPFYYLYNLLWAFLPWTIPVIAGLAAEVNTWFRGRNFYPYSAALLAGVLVLFFIYSIARGKAPNYIMMLMPPLAVVAAGRVQHFASRAPKSKALLIYIQGFVLAIMVLLLFTSAFIIQGNKRILLVFLGALALVVALFYVRAESQKLKQLTFISLIIAASFNLLLNNVVLPALFEYQGARQALRLFEEQRTSNGVLKNLHLEEYELFYWADVPVENFSTWEEFYTFLDKEEPWIYTNKIGLTVVEKLKEQVDTVFIIPQRGMNEISFQFLNPDTRRESLKNNYLIKVK